MTITVTHSKVSAIPDGTDTSVVRPSDWNATHTLVGVGTAASLDAGVANGVATLDSGGQVPLSQLPPLGDLNYQGAWNANTNSPTLTSSTGTKGYYYVVSVAGTTNLNGITDWQIGDWAVFNGSVWQKIDNTDAVTSVNGYTGTVVLTAADVSAVPYTGATGAVDLNAKTLVNVSNLGVNTNTVPTIKIRAVGDNNSTSRIAMRGYSSDANSSAIRVSKFRGTVAAPQAPISGDSLGKFELAGYGTTSADAYPQVSLEGVTTEVWGATARGAKAVVKVTPNTTITQVTALTIDQDKSATFAGSVSATSFSGSGSGLTGVVTSVTGTAPVVSSGGATPAISMAAANTTTNGYLTSTDWNTFNSKGSGSVTSVATKGTVNGLTLTGGPITTTGTVTLGGTLDLSSPPTIGNTAPNTGKFTTLESTGTATLASASTTYVTITGDASYPMIKATGGTNTPLVLSPLGTGALQAQKTDSTATGGNARGANAVDWQTTRSSASQVASSAYSTIGGGQNITSSSTNSTVSGGRGNSVAASESTIAGGALNSISSSGSDSVIAGGYSNLVGGTFSSIVGGWSNTANGYYNFIGGGFANSGTSGSAVTTQAAATNGVTSGSTAVTLAASNAAIKVGQLITGTGIVGGTYVAAISGTSLTLSQNANATGTPTLSFYTPHGVVVGGGNNQATGSYSFIGGGGDAGTAANRNVASGDWSAVGGGQKNVASGIGSTIAGGGTFNGAGQGNTASGLGSFVAGGWGNTASGTGAALIGIGNTSNGSYSTAIGLNATTRGISGIISSSPCTTPIGVLGVSQSSLLVLAKQTTDATATILTSDGAAAGTTNQVILPNNSAYYFKVSVIANVTGGGNTKAWTLEGAIKRGSGVGTTAIVGSVTTNIVAADAGASTWTVTATADTTNGGLAITFTGQASTTIRTVARVDTTEVTF